LTQSGQGASRLAWLRPVIVMSLTLAALPASVAARDGQAGAAPEASQSVAMPTLSPPLAAGPIPDLDLLFTSQVAGWIEPCG
jgi:hypothetical protein